MTRALFAYFVLGALLLGACTGAPTTPNARIVVFTASAERMPRNAEVTLLWQAADAGEQDGLLSCLLTRRVGDDPTETTLQAGCSGGLTEVPPAPVTAATVHYAFKVLKQPYDASDPYLSQTRSVTLDPSLYATRAGGTINDQALGVAALPDGSAIVTGTFAGTATFGATTLTSVGSIDVFVARVDPAGTWTWARRVGGAGSNEGLAVSALPDGGAIVTGYFSGTATFGTTPLTSAGGTAVFVARIDEDGTWTWAQRAGGTSSDRASGVRTLPDGSAIVTGFLTGTATFGTTTLTSAGITDVFVARIRGDGDW